MLVVTRLPYQGRRGFVGVAGEPGRVERPRCGSVRPLRRRATSSDVSPNPFREDPLDGPARPVGTMAVPAVPAFPGRLDARAPRRGECPALEAPVPPRGLCSVLGRRPQRQLPLLLLRMSCRAVGFAPHCADVKPYERAGMRG